MKPVTLSSAEMIACRLIGNMRTLGSLAGNSKSTPYNNTNLMDLNEDSFIGEFAFCKLNNLFFDITAVPRRGGYDCLFHGQRIDVKTTKWKQGKLMVKEINNKDIDVYVLAILDDDTVTFPGYCTVDRLYQEGEKYPNSDGTFGRSMAQNLLTPWKDSQ